MSETTASAGVLATRPDDKLRLTRLLVRCRERLQAGTPADAVSRRGKPKRVPQESVAALLGVSTRWYWQFENAHIRRHDPALVDRVASVLHMTPDEREVLFLLTLGQVPREPAIPVKSQCWPLAAAWQQALDASSLPGYVSDSAWNVVLKNRAFEEVWPPGKMPDNILRFVLLDRDPSLINWREYWALPLLRQLGVAMLDRETRTPALEELYQEIRETYLADPELAQILAEAEASEDVNPDGDSRPMTHAAYGDVHVTLLMTRPMSPLSAGYRIVWMVLPENYRQVTDLDEDCS